MPARSISRCDTISASFGVSRRIGRKKRDRRIGEGPTIREVYRKSLRKKPDRRENTRATLHPSPKGRDSRERGTVIIVSRNRASVAPVPSPPPPPGHHAYQMFACASSRIAFALIWFRKIG